MEKQEKQTKQILERGGEAIIYKQNSTLIKERIKKAYRHDKLDKRLRKKRTKQEAKVLKKLSSLLKINVPKVKEVKEYSIKMEYIEGVTLKEWLEKKNTKEEGVEEVIKQVAKALSTMHKQNISHQDFTPKNIIIKDTKETKKEGREKEVYVIDFGLAINSTREEDKAIDLFLFGETLNSLNIEDEKKKEIMDMFMSHYLSSMPKEQQGKIKERLNKIKKRRRYAQKGDAP